MIPALLLLAAVLLTTGIACARSAPRAWLASTVVGAASACAAAAWVLAGGGTWDWSGLFPIGGQLPHLRLDGLSAFFLALVSVLGALGGIYSKEYWSERKHPVSAPAGRIWWNALLLCMGLVLISANGIHFLIAWELFTVTAYFLITLDRARTEVRKAGWLYLGASHAGTLCLFALFAATAGHTGSWDFDSIRGVAGLAPLFWLALVGFGVKAGLFPLHIWLPSAHANAPSHISAILSGVAIKMGIYGLMRFSGLMDLPVTAGWVVAGLGVASAVLGVAFALGQHDLKRLLAYHSVENIGIILIGLGFAMTALSQGTPKWGVLAMAGGLLHVWNHGVFKALLFLGAGSVLHATGTREMSRLGGLWKLMPWTASCFTLGAAAISGLPPLNGFVSEWLVYLGLFDIVSQRSPSAWAAVPAAVLLAVTGALALACFIKVVGIVFLGLPRSREALAAHECGKGMRIPMLVLVVICLFIGIAPGVLWPALSRAIEAWHPGWGGEQVPAPLLTLGLCNGAFCAVAAIAVLLLRRRVRQNGVERAVTWDCGYAAPTVRMQYTAGSFAAIITEWFAWILRPERHDQPPLGPFPARASYVEHTPETVLEKAVEPAAGLLLATSNAVRRLQHGRIQSYIAYMMIGIAALALLVFLGGAR
jgi:hydrogenase-4 component B